MTYTVESVAYLDAPGITETMMRAMNQDPHYSLLLNRSTTEELIADSVVHTETGDIVGYARWELPDTEESKTMWLDTQMPAATEGQQKSFKDDFDLTETNGKRNIFNYEIGDYIGPGLGKPYNQLVKDGGPYLVLDYLVCHPTHQRKGVASMLLEQGTKEAQRLGLNIFVMTATDPAGTRFYERHGFQNLLTVSLDDSKWGGTTPHTTSFLEKEV